MSGTDKINAANELKAFANRFKNVLACADDLEKLGSIENALNEAQSRVDGLKLQEEATNERIANMGAEFAKAQAEAVASASKIIDDARLSAASVLADAADALTKATVKGDTIIADANARKAVILDSTAEARSTLESIQAEIAEKSATLAQVKADLDALRRKVG